ncbi:MAG TPA: hypothetical protein DCQ90_06475 [Erysipelotrichaceae bacterium]|nr:hypothetical protein [Erysipelotrichaceae bacterium]
MGIFDFLIARPDGSISPITASEEWIIQQSAERLRIQELAIEKAVTMISRVIAKAEFQVYREKNGKILSVKDNVYYNLNIRPNPNQTGTVFWNNVIHQLLKEGEALVIDDNGYYLADTFNKGDEVKYPRSFKEVRVGNIEYRYKTFSARDCLYLTLGEGDTKNYLNNYFREIGDLLAFAASDYKDRNTKRWRIGTPATGTTVKSEETGKRLKGQDYADMIARQLSDPKVRAVNIDASVTVDQMGSNDVKTSSDFQLLLKETLISAAFAYHIPQDVFFGTKTEKSTSIDDFITFACDPIFEIIEDEINAKWVSKEEYLSGEKVKADKSRVKHTDFFDTADAEYKLMGCGYSHNDLRAAKGLETIDAPWANEHNFTLNFGKGGDNSEKVL